MRPIMLLAIILITLIPAPIYAQECDTRAYISRISDHLDEFGVKIAANSADPNQEDLAQLYDELRQARVEYESEEVCTELQPIRATILAIFSTWSDSTFYLFAGMTLPGNLPQYLEVMDEEIVPLIDELIDQLLAQAAEVLN